jgi:centriolar protein POC1
MEVINLEGHNNPIYAVVAHPKKNLCYTAGNDKGIVEWDIALQKFSRLFKEVAQTIYCLEIIGSQNILIAGCNNGTILIFDLETTKLKSTINVQSPVFCIKYQGHKNELLASTDDGKIFVLHIDENKIIHQFQSGLQKVRSLDFNFRLNILAVASNDNSVRLYQLDDYTFIQQLDAHTMGVGALAFSMDGDNMITGSRYSRTFIRHLSNCLSSNITLLCNLQSR